VCCGSLLKSCLQLELKCRTLLSSASALCYSASHWSHSAHTSLVDVQLNATVQLIYGTLSPTPLPWLPVLAKIEPPPLKENRLSQSGGESSCSWQLVNPLWYPLSTVTATVIQESTVVTWQDSSNGCHKSVEDRLEFGLDGQVPLSGWPHNPTTRFWPPSTNGLCWIASALCRVIAVPARRDGDKPTLTCVHVESHKRCLTSSMPVHWQSWLVACPSCTLQMMMPLRGWATMAAHRGCTWQQQLEMN